MLAWMLPGGGWGGQQLRVAHVLAPALPVFLLTQEVGVARQAAGQCGHDARVAPFPSLPPRPSSAFLPSLSPRR